MSKMYQIKIKLLSIILVTFQFFAYGNLDLLAKAETLPQVQTTQLQEQPKKNQKVLAVADFTNDTGNEEMDYLRKGLANSLITSLGAYSNDNISIVERSQLEALIKEMGLAATGLVDISSATKLGNAIGATQVIVGGLAKAGPILRLNVRVIEVKTSKLLLAVSEDSDSEKEIFNLVDKVAKKVTTKLMSELDTSYSIVKLDEPKKEDAGIPLWIWIAGGAVVVAGVVVAVVVLTSKKQTTNTTQPTTTKPILPRPGIINNKMNESGVSIFNF